MRSRLTGRRVVVQQSNQAFAGVVVVDTKEELHLRDAVMIEVAERIPVDGVVIVPRSTVQWVQVP